MTTYDTTSPRNVAWAAAGALDVAAVGKGLPREQARAAVKSALAEIEQRKKQAGDLERQIAKLKTALNTDKGYLAQRQLPALESELVQLHVACVGSDALRSQLFRLGRPDLLDQHFVAQRTVEREDDRCRVARKRLALYPADGTKTLAAKIWDSVTAPKPTDETEYLNRERSKWQAELAAAEAAHSVAVAQLEKLYRQIVAE